MDKKSVYSPCGGYETQPHAMTEPKKCAQERERERERESLCGVQVEVNELKKYILHKIRKAVS